MNALKISTFILIPGLVFGSTTSTTFTANVTVATSPLSITTSDLAFGSIIPLGAGCSASIGANGNTITSNCTLYNLGAHQLGQIVITYTGLTAGITGASATGFSLVNGATTITGSNPSLYASPSGGASFMNCPGASGTCTIYVGGSITIPSNAPNGAYASTTNPIVVTINYV